MRLRHFFFVCIVLLQWLPSAAAQKQFEGTAGEMLAAAGPVDESNLHGVTVLLEETELKIDAHHRVTERRRLIYRIDSPDAVQGWSSVSAEWAPWHQKRPSIRARVITADGQIHELDQSVMSDAPASDNRPEVFDDNRVFSGPLPAVAVGAVIEEEEVTEDTEPMFAAGILRYVGFGRYAPIRMRRLVVEAPSTLPLKFNAKALPELSVDRKEGDGTVRITFEQRNQPAIDPAEPNVPSDHVHWPYVTISTATSWDAIGIAYHKIVEQQIAAGDVSNRGKKNVLADRSSTIASLLQLLHKEVRYTGIEFGGSKLVPWTPAETFKRKFGDCKDKATALVAMLRGAGIRAHVALLSTAPGADIDPALPGMGGFDHAIVFIPGQPDLWIDATAEFHRVGDLPYPNRDRLALVVTEAGGDLRRTPPPTSESSLLIEEREFYLPENGEARIIEVARPQRELEALYRSWYGGGDSKELREQLENYVKNEYLAEKLSKIGRSSGSDLSKPFELRLEVDKGKRGLVDLDGAVVAVRLESIFNRLPDLFREQEDSPEEDGQDATSNRRRRRTADVVFAPFITEWRYTVTPPPAFVVRGLPETRTVAVGPGRLTQKFETRADGTAIGIIRFDTVSGRYTMEETKAAKKVIREISGGDALLLTFDHRGGREITAGNFREGLQVYRDMVAKHPKEAVHHVEFAQALLTAGLGDRARSELREALRIDPKSALAYRILGWVLQHDLIGRRFKPGFDLTGAISAYRKAIELEPKHIATRANLAILLEYDANGERYAPGADLKNAIQEYKSILDMNEAEGESYRDNLLYALAYSQRFAELLEILRTVQQTRLRLGFTLVAIAATEGPSVALEKLSSVARDNDARGPALNHAGTILRNLRMYGPAAELLAAGAKGDSNAARTLAYVQALRGTKRYEEVLLPESDPRHPIQRMFVTWMTPNGITAESVKEFEDAAEFPPNSKVKGTRRQAGKLQAIFAASNTPTIVALDTILANLAMTVEGDDRRGYRIRMQPLGTGPSTAFVAKIGGRYRLIGMAQVNVGVGREVLRLVDAGDLESAKLWLDRAREEVRVVAGDDPIGGLPFPRIWNRGDSAEPGKMRLAALSLIAVMGDISPYVPQLQSLAQGAGSAAEKTLVDLVLWFGANTMEDHAAVKAATARLLQTYPTSESAFNAFVMASLRTRDFVAAEQAIEQRLQRLPDDLDALRMRSHLQDARGDHKRARELMRAILDSGRGGAQDMNSYGWGALFVGAVTDEDINIVQRGSMATQNSNYPILHTLASLYAETGKTKDARELVLHILEQEGLQEPDSGLWYVLGRIAEHYGEPEAALAAYQRFDSEEEDPLPTSTAVLVQARAKGLRTGAVDARRN